MPGDDLLSHADRNTTRAVTIAAPPEEVWPWLAQMGQSRGGLYSYDVLENLVGCDVHSADHRGAVATRQSRRSVPAAPRRRAPRRCRRTRPRPRRPGRSPDGRHGAALRLHLGLRPRRACRWHHPARSSASDTRSRAVGVTHRRAHSGRQLRDDPRMLQGIRARAEQRRTGTPPSRRRRLLPNARSGCVPLLAATGSRSARRPTQRPSVRSDHGALQHRRPCDLYHSALEVVTHDGRFIIEMTPIPTHGEHDRGVVAEGAVGTRWARPFHVFRYEIHLWRDGVIPDVGCAIDSPVRLSVDPAVAQRMLALASSVPTPVSGRDELGAGEMWNSNSVSSWLLSCGGIDLEDVRPPAAVGHPVGMPAEQWPDEPRNRRARTPTSSSTSTTSSTTPAQSASAVPSTAGPTPTRRRRACQGSELQHRPASGDQHNRLGPAVAGKAFAPQRRHRGRHHTTTADRALDYAVSPPSPRATFGKRSRYIRRSSSIVSVSPHRQRLAPSSPPTGVAARARSRARPGSSSTTSLSRPGRRR